MASGKHKLVFNIPYFSTLNPIEFYFGIVKGKMKHINFENRDAVAKGVVKVLTQISKESYQGCYR